MKSVLVTRPKHQAGPFVRELEQYGLSSFVFPAIEIRPVPGWRVPDIRQFSGVFFTSPNSVGFFMERLLEEAPEQLERLQEARVWAVGKTTAKDLAAHGITTEPLSKVADAVTMMQDIDPEIIRGNTFLFLRGNLSLGTIPEVITMRGGSYTEITVYKNIKPSAKDTETIKQMLGEGKLSCLSFTSPSTAINFFEAIGTTELPEGVLVAAIGTTTSAAIEKIGVHVDVIPPYFDGPSFAKAIAEALRNQP
ncbi:MAG: uroporphyrinogen-III synthase [Chlorobi bacterium]|nr:uroporphyrinogen-III synthase [Chlorobiota bacterium]